MDFEAIDRRLAEFMFELSGRDEELIRPAVALTSRNLRAGHTCLDLAEEFSRAEIARLEACRLLGLENSPLVMWQGRLYLRRYFRAEQDLAARLAGLSAQRFDIAAAWLEASLAAYPEADPSQLEAARLALTRGLAVITGGPGTGKTTTVAMILSLQLQVEPEFKICLAAPTGKAADRLRSSVAQAAGRLGLSSALAARLPREAATLHRLLGYGPRGFGEIKPLNYDVVVVDEASMVSLPLMARLLAAVKPGSRLIMLGDKDQLASVEAGYVLGDIYDAAQDDRSGALQDCVVELRRTWRFASGGAIAGLSRAVNCGDQQAITAVLAGEHPDFRLASDLPPDFEERLHLWYADCLNAPDWASRFEALARFRVLCAFNHGPRGTARFNEHIEQSLKSQGLIRPGYGAHYHGRPIMVTRNDYTLGLYNGDIGLVMADEVGDLVAWFPTAGGARRLSLARLPEHETVYAMTVHKSQGSEFDNVTLVLPDGDSPLLTRELIYTGLTRARASLEIIGRAEIVGLAAGRRVKRASGLREALLTLE